MDSRYGLEIVWIFILLLILICGKINGQLSNLAEVRVNRKGVENGLEFDIRLNDEDIKLRGMLGISLPVSVGFASECASEDPNKICFNYGDFANVTLTNPVPSNGNCARIEWTSKFARRLEDCFNIEEGIHMFGGPETLEQYWPTNIHQLKENPYVSADFLTGLEFGNVVENYWLFSTGVAIHVDEENPLFLSYNTTRPGKLCFISADEHPYDKREVLTLKYDVCIASDIKTVHQSTVEKFYKKPVGLPDETMLIRPLWSTWAQYGPDVNQTIVLNYARKVISEGFELSSHIEIDDKWEACYGEVEFDFNKFPDPVAMISEIHSMNLRTTVWAHPFVNFDCPLFNDGIGGEYFIKDGKGKTAINSWWAGQNSGAIDPTNPEAVSWWQERLQNFRTKYNVDAFKFDAGEINWLPYSMRLNGDPYLSPSIYTTKYVEAVSVFGGLVETRVGRLSQEYPVFLRLMDRYGIWGHDAGLKSLIPTALLFGILGYPFILPDMVGGSPYFGWPTKELYIRWLQVNLFMPSIQFSIVPWDEHYDNETVQICRQLLSIREKYASEIIKAANQAVTDGTPINRPLWWIAPTDPVTFTIDQAYMMGDKILVAPVVIEGAVSVDVYLPLGSWVSGVTNLTHVGPIWLRAYPAPLNILPFFIKTE